jgi:hypothetical protein
VSTVLQLGVKGQQVTARQERQVGVVTGVELDVEAGSGHRLQLGGTHVPMHPIGEAWQHEKHGRHAHVRQHWHGVQVLAEQAVVKGQHHAPGQRGDGAGHRRVQCRQLDRLVTRGQQADEEASEYRLAGNFVRVEDRTDDRAGPGWRRGG